jgi:hypothetical protein
MGLKKDNYEVKSMGVTLPKAYAFIRNTKTEANGQGVATIAIHMSRELASNPAIRPFHEEKIYFTVDRNANDRATAYKAATTPRKDYVPNEHGEYVEQEVKPFFYGWENDIL